MPTPRFRDSGTIGYASTMLRAHAVERHLRTGHVGADEVEEHLVVRGACREPEQRGRGVLGEVR